MARFLGFLAIVAALAVTAIADAGNQCVVQTQAVVATPVVATQTIVTPFVATTFVPIAYPTYISVPTYSVSGYANVPQAAPAPAHEPSQCEQTAAVLAKMLDRMDRQNDAMLEIAKRIGGNQIPQPLPPGPPAAQPREIAPPPVKTSALAFAKGKTFVARCASCHDKSVVDAKGMDPSLAFFVNKVPIPLSGDQAFDCLKAMNSGAMPKGQQITEEEFVDIQASIGELRVARAPAPAAK